MAQKRKNVQFGYIPLKSRFAYKHNKPKAILDKIFVHKDCCALFVLFLIFGALTWWSWRKWPDILIDFGRELYVPWQLASGKVLYRDIAYFNGPFSPYFDAFIFHGFGPSFINLVIANLLISALLTIAVYMFFKRCCDRYTAIFCCTVFVTIFVFSHIMPVGNYNWICPYSHDLTHGITFSMLMLLMLQNCLFRIRPTLLVLAGIFLGFTLLTKMEVSLAAVVSAFLGNSLIIWIHKLRFGRAAALVSIFFIGTLLPIAACFIFLGSHMRNDEILQSLSLSWRAVYLGPVTQNKFYLERLGLDAPLRNIILMGLGMLSLFLFACASGLLDFSRLSLVRRRAIFISISGALFIVALFLKFCPWFILGRSAPPVDVLRWVIYTLSANWVIIGRALPVITLILGVVLIVLLVKGKNEPVVLPKLAALVIWAAFAFLLLGKILLNSRVYDYGFGLAMPATALVVAGFLWVLPSVLKKIGATGLTFRKIAVAGIILDIVLALIVSNRYYSFKYFNIGCGGDQIICYGNRIGLTPGGQTIRELLDQIEYLVPKQGNFVVLPEGIMLNYLSRRPNPTRYTVFAPPEVIMYGESNILRSLSDTLPDFIINIPRDMSEYGVGFLGESSNYGRSIMDWISEKYEKIWQEPDYLQANDRFKISILRRENTDRY